MGEINVKIDTSDPVCNSVLPYSATTLYANANYVGASAPIPFTEEFLRRVIAEEIEKAIPRIAAAIKG